MDDAELIPLSALQHYLYCPRQCALIHVEQQWAENRQTAEGGLLHRRVDEGGGTTRRGVRAVRSMPLRCDRLHLVGVADVVEIDERQESVRVMPVEYKRGRPKSHRADEVQLCAQALCLEEMFGVEVPEGSLFYGKTRRRKAVVFDTELRTLTEQTAKEARRMILEFRTPPARYSAKLCDACSLKDICQPQSTGGKGTVASWLARQIRE